MLGTANAIPYDKSSAFVKQTLKTDNMIENTRYTWSLFFLAPNIPTMMQNQKYQR